MATVLDTGGGYPSPEAMKSFGADGIMLYVSGSRPGSNFPGKKLTRDILQMYINAGIQCAPVWQYGKPNGTAPSDFTLGYEGGRQHARAALNKWFECGGPGWTPIYFAVDEDVSGNDIKMGQVFDYFRGAGDEIGKDWVGAYGSKGVLGRLIDAGLLGQRNGKFWAWQPSNWNGSIPDGRATLYQRIIDTAARPGPRVDGIICDVNDKLATDWGQTGINRAPGVVEPPPVNPPPVITEGPKMQEIDQTDNSPNSSSRFGTMISLFVGHTQEGAGTAQSLANYLKNPNSGVSYHYTCDNQTCIAVVDTDLASWSVLDANPRCINFCYAGSRASMSRQEWLDRFNLAIDMHAWLFVRDGRKYGFSNADLRNIGHDEIRAGRRGSTDHFGITKGLGIGNHTDCGPNYPWDVLGSAIAKHATGAPVPPPVPPVNAIDAKYGEGTNKDKLGAPLFELEKTTPDGRGRYKHYEKGSIYWTPSTGAIVVSKYIFDEWAKRGYEGGELGYPVADYAVLLATKPEPQGEVQLFEKGALYRKYGAERGYWVHGLIFAHWRRADYERGPYGWPKTEELDTGRGKYQEFEGGTIAWPNNPTIGLIAQPGNDKPLPDVPEKV